MKQSAAKFIISYTITIIREIILIQEIIILIVQIVAAFGVVVSVLYLGVQVKQQNAITKAQFGFSLTQRLYDRFFRIATDEKFCKLLAKDWL